MSLESSISRNIRKPFLRKYKVFFQGRCLGCKVRRGSPCITTVMYTWYMSSLSIAVTRISAETETYKKSDILKFISSYGLTKKKLLPEFAISSFCLNQANTLWMLGLRNQWFLWNWINKHKLLFHRYKWRSPSCL